MNREKNVYFYTVKFFLLNIYFRKRLKDTKNKIEDIFIDCIDQ